MTRDLDQVAGWEVPTEALFVCAGHTTYEDMAAEFGPDRVVEVTWARVELSPCYCVVGDHPLEAEPPGDGDLSLDM